MMIERNQAVMLLFLDNKKCETRTDQWVEMNQSFECLFQVRTGHHGIADDLKNVRMKVFGGLQTNVGIAAGLSCQIP
ncbi:hypothetical protein D3C85_1838270 [compost metagenome]